MAFVTTFECVSCKRNKHEVVNQDRRCHDCSVELDRLAEYDHMSKLALMPLEERIKSIELQLYRLNADARLKAIEWKYSTYA